MAETGTPWIGRTPWLLLATIHAVPALAFFRPSTLTTLYGVEAGGEVFLLLHHRSALFLAVFVACLWAAFAPATRRLVTVLVALSMVTFLVLYGIQGRPASLDLIALVDLAGLPILALAGFLAFRGRS